MNPFTSRTLSWIASSACLASTLSTAPAQAAEEVQFQNPISKLARAISPRLVQVEDRVTWLNREVFTLAKYTQVPLDYGLGYRGYRPSKDAPDPTIVLDLGKEMPVDSIYLVPAQLIYLEDPGIFPVNFSLEVSKSSDFHEAKLIHRSTNSKSRHIDGIPLQIKTSQPARYIRLTVHKGHDRGANDFFGLSEIFVFSDSEPVSFNATVTTTGSLNCPGYWYPEALIDGRTPLGLWHHGITSETSIGDAAIVSHEMMMQDTPPATSWSAELPAAAKVDRIVLFPYQINRTIEMTFFPESMSIELIGEPGTPPIQTLTWQNPAPGTNHIVPLVFPLDIEGVRGIKVIATKPWSLGNRHMNALSEIELWSKGRNLLSNIPVTRRHDGEETVVTSLTDGFSSKQKISPISTWLDQLHRRGEIENELKNLRYIYGQLVSQTELNVSWGSAVIFGLTFLIPVFFVERRRMRSKEHLDIIRKRIASDLHDDIGSNLGSISLIARTARKDLARLNGPIEIDDDLGEVEMIARESSLAMRDIVWLLERKQDSIGDLVHRMRETAGRLLREIDFTLECTSTRTASKLTLDAKRHLFLFYKEAIHNVIKHSKAGRVAIRLWDEGDQLGLEITDDGIGLPVTKDRTAVSIKKLEDRAEVLNGIMQITSSTETGTCIRLLVKRSYLTSQPKSS